MFSEDVAGAGGQRTLYGFWLSPFMALVAQMLKESGLEFQYQRVSPFIGETLSAEYQSLNALGKIPSLTDVNGVCISESQAICRYLARTYPQAARFYPCHDAQRCAEIDTLNDYITFSLSGPFFNWFFVGGYFPKALGFQTERESGVFSAWSVLMIKSALARLVGRSRLQPFLLSQEPYLPDFHLFHVLELSRTFAELFEIPFMNLLEGNKELSRFYQAMAERPVTQAILAMQAQEFPVSRRELLEEFATTYAQLLKPARGALSAMFGHEV